MTADREQAIEQASAPARWLLDMGTVGIPLTQTDALARAVVREAVERWPSWWDADLHGPPNREAEVRVLETLHDGLMYLGLLRRRKRQLLTTPRGRKLLGDPQDLLSVLALDLGRGDAFGQTVASVITRRLSEVRELEHDELITAALTRARNEGWRVRDGQIPLERAVGAMVSDVFCRAEAYGIVQRRIDAAERRYKVYVALTDGGLSVLGFDQAPSPPMDALTFHADLLNAKGVSAQLAVREDQHLTALHDAIQDGFGWCDDHLYSFWLDNKFWGADETEYTSPVVADEAPNTADVPIAQFDLAVGAKIAYVFDFGDEWRVRLTLRGRSPQDDGEYPRVLTRRGQAPPQYPAYDD